MNIDSSVIEAVNYDADLLNLTIKFCTGSTYLYEFVEPSAVCRFLFSDSIGRGFQEHIKDQYECGRIED